MDYFIFERVQLYTYDVIHENSGFQDVLGRDHGVWLAVHHSGVGYGGAPSARLLADYGRPLC